MNVQSPCIRQVGVAETSKMLVAQLDQEEGKCLELLSQYEGDSLVASRLFDKLDRIFSLRMSIHFVALGSCCGLQSVVSLGSILYSYFIEINPHTPDAVVKSYNDKIDEALSKVINEASALTEIEIEKAKDEANEAKHKAEAAKRQTHNWLWRIFH